MKCTECGEELDFGWGEVVIDVGDDYFIKGIECPSCGDEYQIKYETKLVRNVTTGELVYSNHDGKIYRD